MNGTNMLITILYSHRFTSDTFSHDGWFRNRVIILRWNRHNAIGTYGGLYFGVVRKCQKVCCALLIRLFLVRSRQRTATRNPAKHQQPIAHTSFGCRLTDYARSRVQSSTGVCRRRTWGQNGALDTVTTAGNPHADKTRLADPGEN